MESKKEKVTLSINSEILTTAKKNAIDERCSLSSIVERLLKEYSENKNPQTISQSVCSFQGSFNKRGE